MPDLIGALPGLIALIGLAAPLISGGGSGWPYVIGWLVLLAVLLIVKPLSNAGHRDRIRWALVAMILLVIPGLAFGGFYLLPAALAWLLVELVHRPAAVTPG